MSFEQPTEEKQAESYEYIHPELEEEVDVAPEPLRSQLEAEKGFLSKLPRTKLGRIVSAGVLSLSMLSAIPAEAKTSGDTTPETEISMTTEIEMPSSVEAMMLAENLNGNVHQRIKKLGFWDKIGLVKQVRGHAQDIRNYISSGDQSILMSSKDNLKDIIKLYMTTLPKIKEKDPVVYEKTITELLDVVNTMETKSLSELKKDPRFK